MSVECIIGMFIAFVFGMVVGAWFKCAGCVYSRHEEGDQDGR